MKRAIAFGLCLFVAGVLTAREPSVITISDPVAGKNGHPIIGFDSSANQYLVVWLNRTEKALYARVVKPSGQFLGNPVVISAGRKAGENFAVAFNSKAKEFLVLYETSTTGTASCSMYVQKVTSQGAPKGASSKIAGEPKKLNWRGSLAYDRAETRYLVVWSHEDLMTPTGGGLPPSPDGIYGRFITADGKPDGERVLIQQMKYEEKDGILWHLGYQGLDLKNQTGENQFLLLANHIVSAGEDSTDAIESFLIDAGGMLVGKAMKVSKAAVGNRSFATSLAENALNGQWMAAWESSEREDDDDIKGRIYNRLLGSTGSPVSNEQRAYYDEQQAGSPSLAYNAKNNNFLLVLDADGNPERPVNWDVYGRFLNPDGTRQGSVIKIATSEENEGEHSVAYNPKANNFFVAYGSTVGNSIKILGAFIAAK